LFSFCDDSKLDILFNDAISLELYSSVEELLSDPCDPIVLGFRDCNGNRPEDNFDPIIALELLLIIGFLVVDEACVEVDDAGTWLS
jgi:hypothetical protein